MSPGRLDIIGVGQTADPESDRSPTGSSLVPSARG